MVKGGRLRQVLRSEISFPRRYFVDDADYGDEEERGDAEEEEEENNAEEEDEEGEEDDERSGDRDDYDDADPFASDIDVVRVAWLCVFLALQRSRQAQFAPCVCACLRPRVFSGTSIVLRHCCDIFRFDM